MFMRDMACVFDMFCFLQKLYMLVLRVYPVVV